MAVYPSQHNTFVPNIAATNYMQVHYSRNPNSYSLSRWAHYHHVTLNRGLYLEISNDEATRIIDDDAYNDFWADGDERPQFAGNLESFVYRQYETRRFARGFKVGELAADQAEWKLLAIQGKTMANHAMTRRTVKTIKAATNAANYASVGHSKALSAVPNVGGPLDHSTVARSDVKRTLDYMADQIFLATDGAVKKNQLRVTVSPRWAQRISVTNELRDFVKQQTGSEKIVERGMSDEPNRYGLPEYLHGYEIVVEDCVKNSAKRGEANDKNYAWPEGTILMSSIDDELEGPEGAPNFSTVHVFLKEDLTVEEKHDVDNRRHLGSVVDDFESYVVAPKAGYLMTGTLSA